MAKQTIGVGTTAADGTGDTLRAAFVKVNANTDELYDKADAAVVQYNPLYNGASDETTELQAQIDAITSGTLLLGRGTFRVTELIRIAKKDFKIEGAGSGLTIIECTGTGTGIDIDAFASGSGSDPFIDNCNLRGVTVTGTACTRLVRAQGISRSQWRDVRVHGTSGVDGTIGFQFKGCHLNMFDGLISSYTDNANLPYRGFNLTAGTRNSVNIGGCSNNTFTNNYGEGMPIGLQIAANGGDQNVFLGGSFEACTVYGQVIGTTCRYNTFIGVGYENPAATSGDVNDSGNSTKYINCYSSKHFVIGGSSKHVSVKGGFFDLVTVTAGAKGTTIQDMTVNNWAGGGVGLSNNGTGTRMRNIYDSDLAAYIYKPKARYGVTVTASPFTWTNDQLQPCNVKLFGGTVTLVNLKHETDTVEMPKPSESAMNNGDSCGVYLVQAGDQLVISHTTTPTMNVMPQAGY